MNDQIQRPSLVRVVILLGVLVAAMAGIWWLINWSLTESAVRVVIPVGVAYGTDVRKAMELLLEAAREVPAVMSDPEPRASFEDFGDNALIFDVYFWVLAAGVVVGKVGTAPCHLEELTRALS